MGLRKKTLIFGFIFLIILLGLLSIFSRVILLNGFLILEEQNVRRNVSRAQDALSSDLENLYSTVTDYSVWDDAYDYVNGENPDFPQTNFQDDLLKNIRVDFVLISRCTKETLFLKENLSPDFNNASLPGTNFGQLLDPLLANCDDNKNENIQGLVIINDQPILVASHSILMSDATGTVNGILIFGRRFNQNEINRLSSLTHLSLQVSKFTPGNDVSDQNIQVRPLDNKTIAGFGLIKDIFNQPALILRVDSPREIFQQGQTTLRYFQLSLLVVGFVFLFILLIPFQNFLVSRLEHLSQDVQNIEKLPGRRLELERSGNDEISSLTKAINKMLEAIENSDKKLRYLERRNIINAIPDQLLMIDDQGRISEVHSDQGIFLGIPVDLISEKKIDEIGLPEKLVSSLTSQMEVALDTKETQIFESRINLQEDHDFEFRIVALGNNQALVLSRDITKRKRAEELLLESNAALKATAKALHESEERYMIATRGANDGLWDWDLITNQVYYSTRWKLMLGYIEDEISNSPEEWFSRLHPEDRERVLMALSNHLNNLTSHFECEYRMLHKDGSYKWILTRGLMVSDASEISENPCETSTLLDDQDENNYLISLKINSNINIKPIRFAGSQTDISSRKQAEDQLLHDAFHDPLTDLPNRALFMDRLTLAIERMHHRVTKPFSVLFLDLDRFKVINDSLGHTIGDQLLVALSKRLKSMLRNADTVARLGGDEFVILIEDLPNPNFTKDLAERIQENIRRPFELAGQNVVVSASIGVIIDSEIYKNPIDLLRDADIAMYRAKALGKNRYEIFNLALRTYAVGRLELENELRKALENREFYLDYQPICSVINENVIGFEALLRWKPSSHKNVPPIEFIPVAEEIGLITPIGEWVLNEACEQILIWQDKYNNFQPLSINVNISGVQLLQKDFPDTVKRVLDKTRLAPKSLKLEITESILLNNYEQVIETLNKLCEMDVEIQIDDFGTGYSSLAYLQNFPIQAIKIDRSFISRLSTPISNEETRSGTEIVKTIIAMARDLDMEVIAEGIETAQQFDSLKELKCQYGQGYFLGKPMNSAATEEYLTQLHMEQ